MSSRLGRLADRVDSLQLERERQRVLGARRRLSALRSATDGELRRLRDLLAVDPSAAEMLLRELQSRSGADAGDLHSALSAELRKRDPAAAPSSSVWDLMSLRELRECVGLMKRGSVDGDGMILVSAAAERRIARFERRAELRALLALEARDCRHGVDGCDCYSSALDTYDANASLRPLGRRAVELVARRLHGPVRRRRRSGAQRRRRVRSAGMAAELAAFDDAALEQVEKTQHVEDVSVMREVDADVDVRDDHHGDAGEHGEVDSFGGADVRPARSAFSRIAGSRSLAFSRASDSEFVADVFGLAPESVIDAGRVPAGSAFHLTRRGH